MVNEKYYIKNSKYIRELLNKELIEKRKYIKCLLQDIEDIKMTKDLLKKGTKMAKNNLELKTLIDELTYK